MENRDIQELWKQNEALIEKNRRLNLTLLKEMKIDKMKSSLKELLFLPISTLVFYSLVGSYGLYFMTEHWGVWYFMLAGGVVGYFSIWFAISSIKQLRQILSLDYEAPVLRLQSDLAKLKSSIVRNLRIAAWLLPFGPFVGLFFVKVVFDIDLIEIVNYNMIISFGVVTIILEGLSLGLLWALRPKNINKKWLTFFLQGSGSQVEEALFFLNQIEEFQSN